MNAAITAQKIDKLKVPTRVIVKQMMDSAGLCSVSFKKKKQFEKKTPRTLGGYDTWRWEEWVWADYGAEWYYVEGLPSHLVDGDRWVGWTLVSGKYVYSNASNVQQTVRKLEVTSAPEK